MLFCGEKPIILCKILIAGNFMEETPFASKNGAISWTGRLLYESTDGAIPLRKRLADVLHIY